MEIPPALWTPPPPPHYLEFNLDQSYIMQSVVIGIFQVRSGRPHVAFARQFSPANAMEVEAQALLQGLKTVGLIQLTPTTH